MSIQPNIVERGNREGVRDWLCALMLRRGSGLMPRFVSYYRELARRPRPWRRQLRRKLAVTVSGAALLLALAGPIAPARADPAAPDAVIQVVDGEVADLNNGKCSLIEAIINARTTRAGQLRPDCAAGNLSGPDTVVLPAGGEFVLTTVHNEQFGPTGLPVITSSMTIEGHGATIRRSTTADTFRIIAVDQGVTLTLRDTTIHNGDAGYGGVGGGIRSLGNLVIENSTISDNQGCPGGGISAVTATITGSRIIGNYSYCEDGGSGGGIWAQDLTLSDSTVAGNNAQGGYESFGRGGGIFVTNGNITGSTISGNTASSGFDGIYYNPIGADGGGIWSNGDLTIVNSTISENGANFGGGIHIEKGSVTLSQSTVTGNIASKELADIPYGEDYYVGGYGGGIVVSGQPWLDPPQCGVATLRGTIVSGNTADIEGPEIVKGSSPGADCSPVVNRNAFNVFGRNGNSGLTGFMPGATDIVPSAGLAAILSPLADNGGPTQTHALPAGSPALDLAPNGQCTAAPVNGVDQRSEPRNQNGTGGAGGNECDAGAFELGAGGGEMGFYLSASGSGSVGGVAFAPADILKFDPAAGWSLYFDGSDVGVTKNLTAFEVLGNGDILMSFAANQATPAGTFTPQDVARFTPTATGPNTTGSFAWELDGSTRGLTTSGEKIDALGDVGDGRLALSTGGAANVQLPNGNALKAQDEDALGLNRGNQNWSAYFDGTAIPGLKGEDVNGLWIDPATGDLYVSIVGSFNLGGVSGNGRDIVKLTNNGGGNYTPSLWWDGSAAGFPANIDGLEIVP